jgi:hypothetical protein
MQQTEVAQKCNWSERVYNYVIGEDEEGELSDNEVDQIANHMLACEECANIFLEASKFVEAIRANMGHPLKESEEN